MRINLDITTKSYKTHPFKSQFPSKNIGFTDIKKIKSDKEYTSLLKKLKGCKDWPIDWIIGNKFEQGLMPYIGNLDISDIINTFMRNGTILENVYTKFFVENIIRLFDYSLKKVDKIYGNYQGFVYRYGEVDLDSKNYVSAASNPNGAVLFVGEYRFHCNHPLHVIQIKNGHKIEEVQKKLNYNQTYIDESEIIIEPTNFEHVEKPSDKMLNAKEELIKALKTKHLKSNKIILLKEI